MLWYCLKKFNLKSITHKYLEKGHTQTEGDSMHSAVESASKKVPVYTTGQWATIVRSARQKKPYIVTEMTLKDFSNFKQLSTNIKNFEKTTEGHKVSWNSIKILKLDAKTPNKFQYQTDYEGHQFEVDLFQSTRHAIPNAKTLRLQQLRSENPPITKAKYLDLVSLCQANIVPRAHHPFYILLPNE